MVLDRHLGWWRSIGAIQGGGLVLRGLFRVPETPEFLPAGVERALSPTSAGCEPISLMPVNTGRSPLRAYIASCLPD